MHNRIRTIIVEQPLEPTAIADVDAFKDVAGTIPRICERVEISGIGQRIDVDHGRFGLADQLPDERGADEARTARYE